MKYTTAKTVLKIYRKEGRFSKKKQRLKKGYAKSYAEKPGSPASSSTDHLCVGPVAPKESFPTTTGSSEAPLCSAFWAKRIAEHFN